MVEIGYALSSEEHPPATLVELARRAEEAGFTHAVVSDHFHPWIDRQGQSPFVWTVLGAMAQATERLRLGTGVTCPTIRTHPAIVAHAAATTAALLPGRFFLGVGTGENLNEHVLGDTWPPADVRREMLREAVEVMRLLWQGGSQTHRGRYYTVENARLYSLPDEPPPVYVAASGEQAIRLAVEIGDGLVGTTPDAASAYADAGGGGPRYGQLTVCWAPDVATARRTALEWWPNAGLPGELKQELPLPRHFEQATELVTEEQVAESVVCGPDPERHIAAIREYADAGYDHVYVHQVGPDQDGFFDCYRRDVLPKLS